MAVIPWNAAGVETHSGGSTRRLLGQPGIDLHGRTAPGLLGSSFIMVSLGLLVGGLAFGLMDHVVDLMIRLLLR